MSVVNHVPSSHARQTWWKICRRWLAGEVIALCVDLRNSLFPPLCAICASSEVEVVRYAPLCERCQAEFRRTSRTCPRCDADVPDAVGPSEDCFHCHKKRWSFSRVVGLGEYRGVLRDAVIQSKAIHAEGLAFALGLLLARRIQQAELGPIDFLVPTPQHWTRRITHRTNNSELMGEAIARELNIPMRRQCVRRVRATMKQGMLSATERKKNVRRAFSVVPSQHLAGASVLIIDDVLTSGATASEMAKALRRAGAERIQVAVVARGVGSSFTAPGPA